MLVRGTTLLALATAGLLVSTVPQGADAASRDRSRTSNSRNLAAGDRQFMAKAAMDGMAEVAHGRLAVRKASSESVRRFAQRMIQDHTQANYELKQIASRRNITLPRDMGPKHRAFHNRLMNLSGAAFDRAYMGHMVQDHSKAVNMFSEGAHKRNDSRLRSWITKNLPTLHDHHKMAVQIHSSINGGGSGNGSAATGHEGHGHD